MPCMHAARCMLRAVCHTYECSTRVRHVLHAVHAACHVGWGNEGHLPGLRRTRGDVFQGGMCSNLGKGRCVPRGDVFQGGMCSNLGKGRCVARGDVFQFRQVAA
eukprot:365706-Chlamydomonas_euryale.AAC.3